LEEEEKGVNFVERATLLVQLDRVPFQRIVAEKRSDWLLEGPVTGVDAAGSPLSFRESDDEGESGYVTRGQDGGRVFRTEYGINDDQHGLANQFGRDRSGGRGGAGSIA
jgi:hypothetical protein